MKLRNKKTGEIENWCIDKDMIRTCDGRIVYTSLAELNEEWEDYEEPKQWYGLNAISDVGFEPFEYEGFEDLFKHAKELGIGFETKEEAEKAVEKLKAWKRLKDKGFEFRHLKRYLLTDGGVDIRLSRAEYWEDEQVQDDLDLLFGGEE